MIKKKPVVISVEWGYELHECAISRTAFKRITNGERVNIQEPYFYEGETFLAEYNFNQSFYGSLLVTYDDAGVGFNGSMETVDIQINGEVCTWEDSAVKLFNGNTDINHAQLLKIIYKNKFFLEEIESEAAHYEISKDQVKNSLALDEEQYSNLVGCALYVFEHNAEYECIYPAEYENLDDVMKLVGFRGLWAVCHLNSNSYYFSRFRDAKSYADNSYKRYMDI